jgi:hypothetical protein
LQAEFLFIHHPSEAAAAVDQNDMFHVALVPAVPSDFDWWALWGLLSLLKPRPALLVYAREASFELWADVLDSGGYDVIPEPFSEYELRRAARGEEFPGATARRFAERTRRLLTGPLSHKRNCRYTKHYLEELCNKSKQTLRDCRRISERVTSVPSERPKSGAPRLPSF